MSEKWIVSTFLYYINASQYENAGKQTAIMDFYEQIFFFLIRKLSPFV